MSFLQHQSLKSRYAGGRVSDPAERYLRAARRVSTLRRYAQAVEHFEVEWGGMLPASSESVVCYLAAYGARLSSSTLRTHLAALAQWHQQYGFDGVAGA